MTEVARIHKYWFGEEGDGLSRPGLWFHKDPKTDLFIKQEYGALVEQAISGDLAGWTGEPQSSLALIILTDQFTRNIFRDTARMYAGDSVAITACEDGMRRGFDQKLPLMKRVFYYMPLMHAEDVKRQQLGVAKMLEVAEAAGPQRQKFIGFHDYAIKHMDIVKRFGRFPHRNRILGRTSTPEELEFLKGPDSSF